jgi:hypothetical protein
MLTTSTAPRRRLLLQVTAMLALLLLLGFTALMHSMVSESTSHQHSMASTSATTGHMHGAATTTGAAAASPGPEITMLTAAGCDNGLCALMCSLMGMACALTIAVFAWVLLRRRNLGTLYILARLLALADLVARRVAVPKPPSLTALQIIRI